MAALPVTVLPDTLVMERIVQVSHINNICNVCPHRDYQSMHVLGAANKSNPLTYLCHSSWWLNNICQFYSYMNRVGPYNDKCKVSSKSSKQLLKICKIRQVITFAAACTYDVIVDMSNWKIGLDTTEVCSCCRYARNSYFSFFYVGIWQTCTKLVTFLMLYFQFCLRF